MESKSSPGRSDDEDSDSKSSVKKLCCTIQFFWIPRFKNEPSCQRKPSTKKFKKKKCHDPIGKLKRRIFSLERSLSRAKCSCEEVEKEPRFDSEDLFKERTAPQSSSEVREDIHQKGAISREGAPKKPLHTLQPVRSDSINPQHKNTSDKRSTLLEFPQFHQQPSVSRTSEPLDPENPQTQRTDSRRSRQSFVEPARHRFSSDESTKWNPSPPVSVPIVSFRPSETDSTTSKDPKPVENSPMEPQNAPGPPLPLDSPGGLVNEFQKDGLSPEPLSQRHRMYSPVAFEKPVVYEKTGTSKSLKKPAPYAKTVKIEKPAIKTKKRTEEQKMALVKYYDPVSESEIWVDAMCLTEAWKSQQSPKRPEHRSRSPNRTEPRSRPVDPGTQTGAGLRERRTSSSRAREKSVSFADESHRGQRSSYHVHRRRVDNEAARRSVSRNRDEGASTSKSGTRFIRPFLRPAHGFLPSSREDNLNRPIDVKDFVRFIATLSNNSVNSVGNKRKSINLYKDFLNGNVHSRKKR